ncbi:MAG TPA: hypothetical protein PLX65_03295 [Accumulibacter sp.]|nr:hypothetical protein [Accumulibacter sp.]
MAMVLVAGCFTPAAAELPPDRFTQEGKEYEHEGARYRSHKMRGMWFDILISHQPGCEIDPKRGLESGYVPLQSPTCREKVPPPVFTNPKAPPFRYPEAQPQTHGLDLSRLDVEVAEAYFKWLCENEAGTWIYRVVHNVDGVFAMRNRPNYGYPGQWERWDRYYMEDPWGEIEITEAQQTQGERWFLMPLASRRGAPVGYEPYDATQGYEFYERPILPTEARKYPGYKSLRFNRLWPIEPSYGSDYKEPWYGRSQPSISGERPKSARRPGQVIVYSAPNEKSERIRNPQPEPTNTIQSRYGFFWRGIERTPYDRPLGIGGGEEYIVDLKTNELLALRREFVRMSGGKPSRDEKLDWTWAKSCKGNIHLMLPDVLVPLDPIKARGIDLRTVPTPDELEAAKLESNRSKNTTR